MDDHPLNLELVCDLLQSEGHEVLRARTAPDGIAIARRGAPDLILMDISLPGLDGLEAIRILRGLPETSEVPIVVLTAHAMKAEQERAFEAGCDAYFTKPIDTREFPQAIRNLLRYVGTCDCREGHRDSGPDRG